MGFKARLGFEITLIEILKFNIRKSLILQDILL